jgi:hypothetical protein
MEKEKLKAEIIDTIHRVCTGNPTTCCFGYCKFNYCCAARYYVEEDTLPKTKIRLKGLLKNAKKKERKSLGIKSPEQSVLEQVSLILGQNILEHKLVIGHERTINQIKSCKSIKEINNIFHKRHLAIYGYSLSLPGSKFYGAYVGENHPDFVYGNGVVSNRVNKDSLKSITK